MGVFMLLLFDYDISNFFLLSIIFYENKIQVKCKKKKIKKKLMKKWKRLKESFRENLSKTENYQVFN